MFFEKHILPSSFKNWVWNNLNNRILVFLSLLAVIIQYLIFVRLYPHPNFLPDSYSYIEGALNNVKINLWPVGYSKFLRLVSVFNYTDKALFFVQYVLLQSSIIFFVFTVSYLFAAGKWMVRVLLLLLIINPLWLYISDFVSSDAVFAAFSLLWLTTLIWIIYNPGRKLVLIHGLILFYVFSVRYNALYYPFISVVIVVLLRADIKEKVLRLAFVLIPVSIFIANTTYQYQVKTKTSQFSPFGGWQLASNAMYMYAHVSPKVKEPVPKQFVDIHRITVKHMDSLNHVKHDKRPDLTLGIYYLWNENAPLKSFVNSQVKSKKDSSMPYLAQWAKFSPLLGQYGAWLIKQYPVEYMKYYILPNLINYYVPPTEFMGMYNMGLDSVDVLAKDWFKYETRKVSGYSKDKKITATIVFPIILALINVLFFSSFLGFILIGGFKQVSALSKKILILLMIVWLANLLFSVTASPINLRYQVFPFIFTLTFTGVLLEYIIKEGFIKPTGISIVNYKEIASAY